MEDKNQLSDLMLDKKNSSSKNNKKMLLAIATLGVILIVVVLLMNSLNSDTKNNLPQNPLPPKPVVAKTQPKTELEEPMFEDAEVIDEGTLKDDSAEKQKLDNIAKKLKAQSTQETTQTPNIQTETPSQQKEIQKTQPKQTITKKTHKKSQPTKKQALTGRYYVQVGSFSKSSPDKKFLYAIKKAGLHYRFYKTTVHKRPITKLLIGPYTNKTAAKRALKHIKRTLQKGAFIIKI